MEELTPALRAAEPDRCQEHWYRHAAPWASGADVLDVGAGSGYGMPILAGGGATAVRGIDPLPYVDGAGVEAVAVEDVPDRAYDLIVAMDVIEHVEDDWGLLAHLLRVARRRVFLSTPNWDVSRCANPYHVREYTGGELEDLLRWHRYTAWGGIHVGPDAHPGTAANHWIVVPILRLRDARTVHSFGVLIEAAP